MKENISQAFAPAPLANRVQMPTPRTFNGRKYYGTDDVAKIIGVTRQTVSNWNSTLYFGCPPFTADERAHDGRYLYDVERVMQLKAVYRANWTLGSYEPNIKTPAAMDDHQPAQILKNLPQELLTQPRFFLVGRDKKPLTNDWSNPNNQKLYTEINGIAGFDTCGHGRAADYLFLDFDHVLDDAGNFVNQDAEKWYNYIATTDTFCERSISGHGLHFLLKPTPNLFPSISAGTKGTLHFGDKHTKDSPKLEIFYGSAGRYCFFTGNLFHCEPNAPIAHGEAVDAIFQNLLDVIAYDNKKTPKPTQKPKLKVETKQPAIDSVDYDAFRAGLMLDCIVPADLPDTDWLAVQSAAKNIGIPYTVVDAFNQQDPQRYNEKQNQIRWDSLVNPSFDISTLHGIAKRFGYSEEDARRQWFQLHPEPAKKFQARADFNGYDFLQDTVEDLDNARRLEKYRGKYFRWLTDDEIWLTFNNGIWSRRSEKNSCLYPLAISFADKMINFAKILDRDAIKAAKAAVIKNNVGAIQIIDEQAKTKADKAQAARDKAFAVAYYFKKRKNYSAAIDLLKGCDSILITAADLNRHKNLLCVKNGVVDLQTGKLYPLDAKFLITNQADVFFDPNADIAFVEKFFSEVIPDEPTRQGVFRYLGYCLTGEKNYHICQFWRGRGANGKTTILDMLIKLFGSYAIKLPTNALIESMRPLDANAASPALAMLDGDIRLAILDEIPRNCRLDATTFKTITGDQFITARHLYCNPRKIELRAKLILNGNHLPNFDVDDGGLQRRINNVEYTEIFPADRADVTLSEKLATTQNRSALLNILIAQSQSFYRDGLIESDAMKDAKAVYFSENDFVSSFVEENCIIGDGSEIRRKDFESRLIAAYPAETSRLKKKDLLRVITDRLNSLGVTYIKAHANQNVFRNIRWA